MTALLLTLGWVAGATGGSLRAGDAARPIGAVVSDSHLVQAGDLFIALTGPRFDGHAFVAAAAERGAAGAIVARGRHDERGAGPEAFGIIDVDDTLAALQALAREVRRAADCRVVAITGSAGKTTTKEAIAEFLGGRYRVVRNPGNLNNHIGLPLSLMQLRTRPDVAVMELGMNHAGEIRRLVDIARPDVRVWTNVGEAHLGFFASPDAIADAKAEILEGAGAGHLLVCNADDPRVMARVGRFPGRVVTFGMAADATVRMEAVEDRGLDGMRARLVAASGAGAIETPLLGRGNLANVVAAAAVALEFHVPFDEIVATAARLRPADRRGAVRRLRGVTVIDDSYNSSPSALTQALQVLAGEPRAAGKVAVLGEMLELGAHSVALHEACGRAAGAAGLRRLFTVGGGPARAMADAAVAAGMPAGAVTHVAGSDEAAPMVTAALEPGDLVLVKGSRGIGTDRIADRIAAEYA